MYVVSIASSGLVFNYTFKNFKDADECFRRASKVDGRFEVEDDYGARGNLDLTNSLVNFTDIAKDADMQGEIHIIKQKSALKAQTAANNDMGLQLLSKTANSRLINPQ